MAEKIHFKATVQGTAACACGMVKPDGSTRKNYRQTYSQIPASFIVSAKEFRATPDENRCAHCSAQFTERMNARRKILGLPLYKNAFTKELA